MKNERTAMNEGGAGDMDGLKLEKNQPQIENKGGLIESQSSAEELNRGGNNASKMHKPENIDLGNPNNNDEMNEIHAFEQSAKNGHKRVKDILGSAEAIREQGLLKPEVKQRLSEIKTEIIGADGKPVTKTGVDAIDAINKEIGMALATGEAGEGLFEALDLTTKLMYENKETDTGKQFYDIVVKDYLGGGDELRGQRFYNWVTEQIKGAEKGGEKAIDINELQQVMGISDQEMADLKGLFASGGAMPAPEAKSAVEEDVVSPAPISAGGKNEASPAPIGSGGGGNGGLDGLKNNYIDPRGGAREMSIEAKRFWYGAGIIALMLLIFYFGAMGKLAKGIEQGAERSRQGK